jgi:uncharacterized protein
MTTVNQFLFNGANRKPTLYDVTQNTDLKNNQVVLLLHGFKSFKDWGFFPFLAQHLALQGYTVIKLNFSHNGVGTTVNTCLDFVDLESFAQNNFTKELQDIAMLLQHLQLSQNQLIQHLDLDNISVLGHSRGGGIAILAAQKFAQIKQVITLNALSDFANLFTGIDLQTWQQTGVHHIANARTKQEMPLGYQLYEDYQQNADALNILHAIAHLNCPIHLVHCLDDETVKYKHALALQAAQPKAFLHTLAQGGHTFGSTHPFVKAITPLHVAMEIVTDILKSN